MEVRRKECDGITTFGRGNESHSNVLGVLFQRLLETREKDLVKESRSLCGMAAPGCGAPVPGQALD